MKTKRLILLSLLAILVGNVLILMAPAVAQAATVEGKWLDKGTIEIGGAKYIDGKPDDDSRDYYKDGKVSGCTPVIRDFKGDNSEATLYKPVGAPGQQEQCGSVTTDKVHIDPASLAKAGQAATTGSGGGESTDKPSCEKNGGEMSWILCPVLRLMDGGIKWLDEQINGLLVIPPRYYNTPELKETWGRLRNVALIILVPMMLVMVISTALGFEFISAYTVKKALPRLLMAAIFITLSWPLMVFAVEIVTIIGQGIGGLLTSSFGGLQSITLASLFNSNGVQDGGIALVGLVGGLAVLSVVSIGILLSYAFIALLGLFLGFILLSLRQFLVVALMLLAPLAILAWVFPGNDKIWKLWKESFVKLLLLYPTIIILIAGGRIFAKIVHDANQGGFAASLIKLVAYVGPYFFIPAVFKFAGGAFSTLSGMANDKGRGLFDRQKKYRGQKMSQNWAKTGNYSRFSDRNKLSKGLNTVLGAGRSPRDLMHGKEGINAGRRTGRTVQGADAFKNDPTMMANQQDDNFLLAVANEGLATQKRDAAIAKLDVADKKFKIAQASGDQQGMNSAEAESKSALAEINARNGGLHNAQRVSSRKSNATRLAALNQLSKTGYQFSAGDAGYQELAGTVGDITGQDTQAFSAAMNEAQFHLKSSGARADLGGINNGSGQGKEGLKIGVRKLGNYGRGQGKVETYYGGAAGWLGADAVDHESGITAKTAAGVQAGIHTSLAAGTTSHAEIAEYHSMLLRDRESATDQNKLEINKQLEAIQGIADSYTSPTGPPPRTPEEATERSAFVARIAQNRAELQRAQIDPSEIDKK